MKNDLTKQDVDEDGGLPPPSLRVDSDSIVASCDCLTKTNEVKYHKPGCKYRLICERDQWKKEAEELAAAFCPTCLAASKRKMPDVKLEDLRHE